MKKITLLFSALALTLGASAQIATPQASPFQKIEQKVGVTDVTIEYSRPSAKGRTIFGDLVPHDKLWRTGANTSTTITFGDDVEIGGKTLTAGSYAIYTKPGATQWEVYFYAETGSWGLPKTWDDSKVAAQLTIKPKATAVKVETFTMTFDDLTFESVTVGVLWENTYIGIPIKFYTDKAVTAGIERTMDGPSSRDYYSAAVYYFTADKDINKAKEWIDKAITMTEEPTYWQYRKQSLIYAKAGDKKGAIEVAKKSLELAKKNGSPEYVKMNEESLKEWGAK